MNTITIPLDMNTIYHIMRKVEKASHYGDVFHYYLLDLPPTSMFTKNRS